MDLSNLVSWAAHHKENNLFGRYIRFQDIEPIIKKLPNIFSSEILGYSFKGIPIYGITVGNGKTKILLWSQMHGNESTGTKALFDIFKWLDENDSTVKQILRECTLVFIPILNPDGAEVYTRVNAQNIDLNRDAVDCTAPESKILKGVLKKINPKFCFNLHDQRTIFSVGDKPATISFLAPSEEESRQVTEGRKITMSVISSMYAALEQIIPNQIGRYTDEFYPTATGDNFQKAGYNTILIEAGHYQDDYNREEVRKLNFVSLVAGIYFIATEKDYKDYETYFNIPNNEKKYLDVIYKNIVLLDEDKMVDVGVIFKEILEDCKIVFKPTIEIIDDLSDYNANTIINKKGEVYNSKSSLSNLFVN
ncbi:M14 metallopeptidase family protein [Aureibaculum sp. 2210JD6-5]|uniref:M14 family metallopeptidase n=1 Tax=Aureibaculum sp. 2210JD6-5 TaxID=3103957 RepID=UPI002AAE01B4|nr:M14 metallopeptidase family protein [Aureibaculum sp. 2210JD6-5]MDY7394034.1 M14 metallopeptidase family protein [Aureibaculum sp. 2210JD6-5]